VREISQIALQVIEIAETGAVVVARMHDESRLADLPDLTLHLPHEPQPQHHTAGGLGAVEAGNRLHNEGPYAGVLDPHGSRSAKTK
jgi:hypothetical protein